jgi:hypothetical protein
MANSFEILAKFLDRFGDDVEGRSLEEPSADVKLKLKSFAAGSLSEAERNEMIGLLQANPQWVPLLAREAKALRNDASQS